MRSYFKAYGPADQSFLSASGHPDAPSVYWVKKPRKTTAIALYNFISKGDSSVSPEAILVWKLLDLKKGLNLHSFPLNHIITQDDIDNQALEVAQFSGQQLAGEIYPVFDYASHPLN